MTVALFKRMSFVFEQVNADQTLFVTLNEAHGLTFTKDKALKAKTADIACYVLSKLDAVIQNPSLQNKKFEKSFYSNVVDYFEAESLDKPLLALIRSCLYASEMKVKTKRNDFVDFVGRCAVAFSEVHVDPDTRFLSFDADYGLIVTKDKTLEASAEQVAEYLRGALEPFIEAKEFNFRMPSHNGIYALQRSAIPYFEKHIPKDRKELHEICHILALAEEKWLYFRAQAKLKDEKPVEEYERWLKAPPETFSKTASTVLGYARDILFFLQKMHHFARRYTTLQLAIAERIEFQSAQNINVLFRESAFTYALEDAPPLHKAVMRSCKYVAKEGITSRVDSTLKLLLEYKKDPEYSPELYERFISFLELNELFYLTVKLEEEWMSLAFSSKRMVLHTIKEFRARTYLPAKQLEFLTYSLMTFKDNYIPSIARCSVRDQAISIKAMAKYFSHTLDTLGIETHDEFHLALTKSLQTMLKGAPKRINELTCRRFSTEEGESFEEYYWTNITLDEYTKTLAEIQGLKEGIALFLPTQMVKVGTRKPLSEDRGFAVDIPKRQIQPQKPKKKKVSTPSPCSSPSPLLVHNERSRSASPEEPSPPSPPKPLPKVEELTLAVAKLSIAKIPEVAVVSREPEIPVVRAKLKYDIRVLRWYYDKRHVEHPFNADSEYQGLLNKPDWIVIEHNVARYIDLFYEYASIDKSPESEFGDRRQLVLAVTRSHENRESTRVGLLTWTKSKVDGLIYHRWFVKEVPGKTEHFDERYVQEAFEQLKARPLPPPFKGKPRDKERDESFLELKDERFIVISDPKNSVRVRLILPNSSI